MRKKKRMLISIVNESSRVTDAEIEHMVHALGIQLSRDVAPIWGQVPVLEFAPSGVIPNGIVCTVSDTPDVPGAAGYHDEGDDGKPFIKVFTFEGASSLVGPDALSVTLSHEILEVVGDAPANKWADGPGGADYAFELCDAVEGDTYEIDGVSVSNFVYPAFFDPKASKSAKLAHLDTIAGPFLMSPRGYQIRRTEPGHISQVFAARSEGEHAFVFPNGLGVLFGKDYPENRKSAKLTRATRRRGNNQGRFPLIPTPLAGEA
jgi:hypothetical protein